MEHESFAGPPHRPLLIAIAGVTAFIPPVGARTIRPAGTLAESKTAPASRPAEQPVEAPFNLWTQKRLTGNWFGLRDDLKSSGIDFSLSYQHQIQGNTSGGLDTSHAWRQTGSYDAVLELDLGRMRLMPDAGVYFKWKGAWSESDYAGINNDKVGASGAARVNSDVDDDIAIYINKWWFWKRFFDERVELRLGLIETVKDLYDVSLYANHEDRDFLNRLSFRNATIPHQTGVGAHLSVTPVDWFYVQMGAFDPQRRGTRTGFDTAFHGRAWFVGMWEIGLTPKCSSPKGPMPGRYRAGLWYDPQTRTIHEHADRPSTRSGNVGFYLGADQMIWKENHDAADTQGLGLYTRYGHAQRDIHTLSDYWSLGVSYRGLIPTRDKDVTAFGVSQAVFSSLYRQHKAPWIDRETVCEWYYKCYITPWLNISPDVQVITGPSGNKRARDAIVAGVRIQVTF